MQTHKYFHNGFGHLAIHREIFLTPINRGAEAANLTGDSRAGSFFPLPHLLQKLFTTQVVTGYFLRIELALNHDLRCDTSVICARYPQGIFARHAGMAHQAIHDGLVKSMTHV